MYDLNIMSDGDEPEYSRGYNINPDSWHTYDDRPAGHLRSDEHSGVIIAVAPYRLGGGDYMSRDRDYPFDHAGFTAPER